ncbi:hypothetical protein T484DRAFT_1941306 [Baffinella frigidus]|nr:hypothetical protein T484DRAFT_1941306 [Cryptophyta sp. CCMP2293]
MMARVLLAASLAAMALPASSFLMPGVSTVAAHLSSSNAASVRAAPMALRTGIRRPLALAMQDAAAAPVFAGDLKKAVASALSSENAGTIAAAFEGLKKEGAISKWNSQTGMKSRAVSQNELKRALKTDKDLDELLGLVGVQADLKQLTLAAFAFSAVIGVGGSIIGGQTGGAVYWVTYLGAAAPLVLIGVGSVAPGIIGDVLAKATWAMDETNTKERRVKHEAAHLLAGYLCGLPIEGYVVEPSPACIFYDRIEGNMDAIEAWKKARPLNDQELDTLSVVSMSGLMGELTSYDKADGGQGDLEQLQEFFFRAESEKMRNPAKREDQTRWGAMESLRILNNNAVALKALCEVMGREGTVEECIEAIEKAKDEPATAEAW